MTALQTVAGVELGGTKTIAVLARGQEILQRRVVATTNPDETLSIVAAQLAAWNAAGDVAALGIASFGPIDLDPASPRLGHLLATPKPGWGGAAVGPRLAAALDLPWRIDTDVNGAALAEVRWGAALGAAVACYITIGTGVGGGIAIDGRSLHGALHPEIGHLMLRRAAGDPFGGVCPFHGDCVEGLVSGPALLARIGGDPSDAPDDHPVWDFVASDIAGLVATLMLGFAPQRVLIGGGVFTARPFLLPMVQRAVLASLGGYLPFVTADSVAALVRAPGLGADAGPLGAVALAYDALAD